MSDYCLRFNAAVIEVNDLTAENEQLQKRIAELEALILKAGPLHWVAHHDMDGAKAWEKDAAELIPIHISEGGADD